MFIDFKNIMVINCISQIQYHLLDYNNYYCVKIQMISVFVVKTVLGEKSLCVYNIVVPGDSTTWLAQDEVFISHCFCTKRSSGSSPS